MICDGSYYPCSIIIDDDTVSRLSNQSLYTNKYKYKQYIYI